MGDSGTLTQVLLTLPAVLPSPCSPPPDQPDIGAPVPVPLTPGSPALPAWLEFTFGLGDWTSPTDLKSVPHSPSVLQQPEGLAGWGDGSQPLFCLTSFPKPHRCEELVTLLFVQPYEWLEGLLTEGLFVCRPG